MKACDGGLADHVAFGDGALGDLPASQAQDRGVLHRGSVGLNGADLWFGDLTEAFPCSAGLFDDDGSIADLLHLATQQRHHGLKEFTPRMFVCGFAMRAGHPTFSEACALCTSNTRQGTTNRPMS